MEIQNIHLATRMKYSEIHSDLNFHFKYHIRFETEYVDGIRKTILTRSARTSRPSTSTPSFWRHNISICGVVYFSASSTSTTVVSGEGVYGNGKSAQQPGGTCANETKPTKRQAAGQRSRGSARLNGAVPERLAESGCGRECRWVGLEIVF